MSVSEIRGNQFPHFASLIRTTRTTNPTQRQPPPPFT